MSKIAWEKRKRKRQGAMKLRWEVKGKQRIKSKIEGND
jgi:hypothetical protein